MRVGIDTGGTFTDLVLLNDQGGTARLKVPSTPDDPARALLEGLRQALAMGEGRPAAAAGRGQRAQGDVRGRRPAIPRGQVVRFVAGRLAGMSRNAPPAPISV